MIEKGNGAKVGYHSEMPVITITIASTRGGDTRNLFQKKKTLADYDGKESLSGAVTQILCSSLISEM
jgi:hypothetical protein